MRKEIITAASVLALMTGAAMAQTSSPDSAVPGATTPSTTMQNAPSGSSQSVTGGQMAAVDHLLGKNVYGQDNEKIGEVEDIILDSNGQAKQLVISSGGFLGIGEKQVAVDYTQAQWDQQQDRIHLSGLKRDQVKDMPEFEYSDTTTSLNRNKDKGTGMSGSSTTAPAETPK